MTTTPDCSYCIGWFLPAGVHADLGEVYQICRHCFGTCSACTGEGLFPAATRCLACLIDLLSQRGLTPVLCRLCLGVVDLVPRAYLRLEAPHERC
jgi:hypothetical protein